MRTIIDIEKEKLQMLTEPLKQQATEDVFAILKERHHIEGLAFQYQLRSEWS